MKTIAIYPGSFNPFTVGHQNVLEKAERIFGKENVIISIGINPEKMSVERQEMIKIHGKLMLKDIADGRAESLRRQLPTKNVEWYTDFLTEYVRKKEGEGYNVVVIRGLRNGYDYDYEYNQTRFMWDQMPGMNIVCIFCDPIFSHISSSAYRALEKVKPGSGHKYLAKEVEFDTSEVKADMVETATSVVIENKAEVDMLLKHKIVPMDSVEHYNFKGTYKECLEWIKEQEDQGDKDEDIRI